LILALNRRILIAFLLHAVYSLGISRAPKVLSLGLFAVMAFVAWLVSLLPVIAETWLLGWQQPTILGWFHLINERPRAPGPIPQIARGEFAQCCDTRILLVFADSELGTG